MMGEAALLEVSGLSFGYGPRAILREISFRGLPGEFLAVVGSNGAGKSTLLDLLAGYRRTQQGVIAIAGRAQREFAPRELAHWVSHLPQAIHADLPFTAGQLVAMGRYPHTDQWFESEEDQGMVDAAMRRTGCLGYFARAFASLSGGERQRVLLAACLAQDARILLLDEPSTFLDVEAQLECFSLLREEAAAGKLCIAVTHDLNLALTYASRLLVIADGRLVEEIVPGSLDRDAGWLERFSPRLRLGRTPRGTPWVWYE
jgi:iron complex transport system ATP-binding protein